MKRTCESRRNIRHCGRTADTSQFASRRPGFAPGPNSAEEHGRQSQHQQSQATCESRPVPETGHGRSSAGPTEFRNIRSRSCQQLADMAGRSLHCRTTFSDSNCSLNGSKPCGIALQSRASHTPGSNMRHHFGRGTARTEPQRSRNPIGSREPAPQRAGRVFARVANRIRTGDLQNHNLAF